MHGTVCLSEWSSRRHIFAFRPHMLITLSVATRTAKYMFVERALLFWDLPSLSLLFLKQNHRLNVAFHFALLEPFWHINGWMGGGASAVVALLLLAAWGLNGVLQGNTPAARPSAPPTTQPSTPSR